MTKEELTIQSPEDVSLQKYKSSLIASGGAMVLFSLWTVLRSVVQVDQFNYYAQNDRQMQQLVTAILVVTVADLILKLYVGLSARVEGLGRSRKRPYLVLGIIIAALSLVWVIYMLVELPTMIKMYGTIEPIVSLAVEATVLYAAMDLVFAAVKVRKLEKEMGRV